MFTLTSCRRNGSLQRFGVALAVAVIMTVTSSHPQAFAQEAKQKTFKSPEEAVKALVEAAKGNDAKELLGLLGPAGKEVISSGDEVTDKAARERFVQLFRERNALDNQSSDKAVLSVGDEDWPFPIPIVKEGETWRFDTAAGKEELVNRRIGKNELNAIELCHAYVEAQREYASKDWDGDGVLEYAQRFVSAKGKWDGLYWEAAEDEVKSPLGPLVAKAALEGYTQKGPGDNPAPYHGYYYKILKAQGKNAPGGAYSYIINGHMVAGFALVAYPAEYASSGIMTFIVNQRGIVYQKDLGKKTGQIAQAMQTFDPDKTWQKVD